MIFAKCDHPFLFLVVPVELFKPCGGVTNEMLSQLRYHFNNFHATLYIEG